MRNGKEKPFDGQLKIAFESGYSNAAAAFSQLTNDQIVYNNFHFGFHAVNSNYFNGHGSFLRTGSHYLITTEIFGDVTGKSYLLLSENEFNFFTRQIPDKKNSVVNLKEEFIKELDNILSASVITKLSNQLQRKMYGDIPILIGRVQGQIEEIIYDDFNEQADELYVNSAFFSFQANNDLNPFFIWVIDTNSIRENQIISVERKI